MTEQEESKLKLPPPKVFDEYYSYKVPAGEEGQAWEKLPGESGLWYRRFTRYRLMGPARSVMGCFNNEREARGQKRSRKSPGQRWYSVYNRDRWEERAQAWDGFVLEEEEKLWRERRTKIREREYELVDELFKKVEDMLMFPVAEQETITESEGGRVTNITVIKPTDWKLRDITALLDTASKVGRLSSGMATGIEEARHVIMDKELTEEQRVERVGEILKQARIRKESEKVEQ